MLELLFGVVAFYASSALGIWVYCLACRGARYRLVFCGVDLGMLLGPLRNGESIGALWDGIQ